MLESLVGDDEEGWEGERGKWWLVQVGSRGIWQWELAKRAGRGQMGVKRGRQTN